LNLPSIEGLQTGGLSIVSYQIEQSQDEITWTTIIGLATDNPLTYFVKTGLTTG
jgi:hypothetical protein